MRDGRCPGNPVANAAEKIFNVEPEKRTQTYVYGGVSSERTDAMQEIRGLQGFLAARGLRTQLTGVFCRRTVTAAQTYLRDCVDRTVAVDGICGPHTGRALESVRDDIHRRLPPQGKPVRLVMHTTSRKRSDFFTFEAEAMRLEGEYKRAFPNDTVRRVLVRNGKEIADAINACTPGSIVSWDVLSHSNAGGIHISEDLAQAQASSADRQRRHVEYRAKSRNPQSAKDAMFMEEDMRGLYTSHSTAELVADYFNQLRTSFLSTLDEVEYDRFSRDCYVELHGCRTVNDDASIADLFIANLSARLPADATVVGHTRGSFPQGARGYRHGEVGVFRAGCEMHRGRREQLKLPNASTPGHDDDRAGAMRITRRPTTRRQPPNGRRDFKEDWPQTTPPGRQPPRICTPPRRDPPRTCPPRGGDPQYPPRGGDPQYPPRGGDPQYPPRGCDPQYPPQYPPRGRDPQYPPRGGDPQCPPRGRDPQYPPPPRGRDPQYPPPRGRDPQNPPPRGRDPQNPPRDPQRPPRDDRRERNDQTRQDPQGSEVPWAALLTGAAVVGGMVMERRRQRDRDRDRDRRQPPRGGQQPPRTPAGGGQQPPRTPARTPAARNPVEETVRTVQRGGNPLGSMARGLLRR